MSFVPDFLVDLIPVAGKYIDIDRCQDRAAPNNVLPVDSTAVI